MKNKIKLLYVDDEPINLELFKYNFEEDYLVLTGISGYEGLKILEENPEIKVVISDMKMPEMNGIEFIKTAKNEYPRIAYYILTGYEINNEIQEALETNLILKYFSKPFNIDEIQASITAALSD